MLKQSFPHSYFQNSLCITEFSLINGLLWIRLRSKLWLKLHEFYFNYYEKVNVLITIDSPFPRILPGCVCASWFHHVTRWDLVSHVSHALSFPIRLLDRGLSTIFNAYYNSRRKLLHFYFLTSQKFLKFQIAVQLPPFLFYKFINHVMYN